MWACLYGVREVDERAMQLLVISRQGAGIWRYGVVWYDLKTGKRVGSWAGVDILGGVYIPATDAMVFYTRTSVICVHFGDDGAIHERWTAKMRPFNATDTVHCVFASVLVGVVTIVSSSGTCHMTTDEDERKEFLLAPQPIVHLSADRATIWHASIKDQLLVVVGEGAPINAVRLGNDATLLEVVNAEAGPQYLIQHGTDSDSSTSLWWIDPASGEWTHKTISERKVTAFTPSHVYFGGPRIFDIINREYINIPLLDGQVPRFVAPLCGHQLFILLNYVSVDPMKDIDISDYVAIIPHPRSVDINELFGDIKNAAKTS